MPADLGWLNFNFLRVRCVCVCVCGVVVGVLRRSAVVGFERPGVRIFGSWRSHYSE